jgi:tetratricopeptide (TPR) repeat protein
MKKLFLLLLALTLLPALVYCASDAGALENFERFSQERALIREAEQKIDAGEFADAGKLYGLAAKDQREPARAAGLYYQQAQCYLKGKKVHKAREVYLKLLNSYLFYVPVEEVVEQLRELADLFWRGEGTLLGISDPDAAIDLYRVIIKYQPSIALSLNDRLVLAQKLEERDHYEDAVATCQETIKLAPENADVRLQLGKLLAFLAKRGDGDGQRIRSAAREATSFLTLASEDDPRRAEAEEIIKLGKQMGAERLMERAEFYLNKYHYRPAVARRYLHDIIRDYPESTVVTKANELLERLATVKDGEDNK